MSVHVVYVADPIDNSRFDNEDYRGRPTEADRVELLRLWDLGRAQGMIDRGTPMDLAL